MAARRLPELRQPDGGPERLKRAAVVGRYPPNGFLK